MGKAKMIWIVLFIGAFLRILNLNQSLWLDEAISAIAARDYSFVNIIKDFLPNDTHPPLYYFLLKLWTSLFGFSEISMRTLSVVLGVLTVWVVYLIGKKVKDERLGILASAFLTTAPLHVYYSQEVRMYSLSAFAVALSVFSYLTISERPKSKHWILFSLSLLFVGLADYLPLLIIPVFWLFGLIKKRSQKWWQNLFLSHLPLLVFSVLWFPIFYRQSLGSSATLISFPAWGALLGKANLKELLLVWVKFVIGRISVEQSLIFLVVLTVVSTPFVYSFAKAFKQRDKFGILWLWLTFPIAVSFIGSYFVPGFSFFRLIFVLPAFYLLAARGAYQKIISRVLVMAIFCVNIVFSLVYISNDSFWREDWRSAVAFVENEKDADLELMAFAEPFAAYRWYGNKRNFAYGVINFGDSKNDVRVNLENLVDDKDKLFTFDYLADVSDPKGFIQSNLKELGFQQVDVYNFRGVGQIRLWEK